MALAALLMACGSGGHDHAGTTLTPNNNTTRSIESLKMAFDTEENELTTGSTKKFEVLAIYDDGSEENITDQISWQSADEDIISIDSGGNPTAKSWVANTQLTASFLGKNIDIPIQVVPASDAIVSKLVIAPEQFTMTSNESLPVTVKAIYSDGSEEWVTDKAIWSVSDEMLARIDSGLVQGLLAGEVVLSASYETHEITANLTITPSITVLPSLVKLSIQPDTATLSTATQSFQVIAHFDDDSTTDITTQVTWQSSAPKTASIANGIATPGNQAGTSIISASYENQTVSANITVTLPIILKSITLSPASASLLNNATQQLVVNGFFSDGSSKILSEAINWLSSDNNIATINNGTLTPGSQTGTVTITAEYQDLTAQAEITITAATTLVGITLSPNEASIDSNASQLFSVTGNYSDGTNQALTQNVIWSSSDQTIALIDNGIAAAGNTAGSTIITATFEAHTANATLQVSATATLKSIELQPDTASISTSETQQYQLVAYYSDDTNQMIESDITWSSSDSAIVSINDGIATAIADTGSVNIEANYNGKQSSANLTIILPKRVNQGSIINPAALPFSPQGNIHQMVLGNSYYQMDVVKNVTYDLIISHAANRINDFSLRVFDDANFTNLICAASSDTITELRCTLTPEKTPLYLSVTYTGNREVEDILIRTEAQEGQPETPVDIGKLPALHISQIGFNQSFYQLSILPNKAYQVKITGYKLTATMDVYQNVDFSNPLCLATRKCQLTTEDTAGLNQLYLKVDGRQTADGARYAIAASFAMEGSLAGDGFPDEAKDLGEAPLSTVGQVDGATSYYWVSAIKGQVYNVRISDYRQVLTLWINSNFQCAARGENNQTVNCLVMPNIDGFAMSIDGKETGGGTTYNIEVSEVNDPIYHVKTQPNGAGRSAYTFIQVYTLAGELFYQRGISEQPFTHVAFPLTSGKSVNIRITNPFQESGNNGYSIRVDSNTDGFATDLIPTDPDTFEPDDNNPTGATELLLGTRSDHTLSTNDGRFGDEDWFIFTAP